MTRFFAKKAGASTRQSKRVLPEIAILVLMLILCAGQTQADSVIIDFDRVLMGVDFDPEKVDFNGEGSAIGNGIPDAIELALVSAVLADPTIDFSSQNGVSHDQAYAGYLQAQQSAAIDLQPLNKTWSTSVELGIAYALLGEVSFNKLNQMATSFGAPMVGDYSLAWAAGESLSVKGDADGDGFTNLAEFRVFGKASSQNFVDAALNPGIQPDAEQLAGLGELNDARKNVGIVLYPGFEVLDVFGPLEMWAYVPDFNVVLIAEEDGPIMSAQGVAVVADYSFETAPSLDILMVPGGTGSRVQLENKAFLDYIDTVNESTLYTTSVCTGSALLAKAGILNGHQATTNKRFFFLAEEQSKEVSWVVDARWVESGKMFTSSGVSAGTDMALGVVAKLYGIETARDLASSVEYEWHEEATVDPFSQYVNRLQESTEGPGQLLQSQPADGAMLDEAPQWMRLFFSKLPQVDASQLKLTRIGDTSEEIPLRGMHNMGSNDLMIEIVEPLEPGAYEVSWMATFDDEENALNGSYRFAVSN